MKQILFFMFLVLYGCNDVDRVISDPVATTGSCSTSWYRTDGRVSQITCGAGKIMEMTPSGIVCRCPPPCPGGDCKR